jgi:hypothetical protein
MPSSETEVSVIVFGHSMFSSEKTARSRVAATYGSLRTQLTEARMKPTCGDDVKLPSLRLLL